jgi:imidazolonepropionase-like amidohydrolase
MLCACCAGRGAACLRRWALADLILVDGNPLADLRLIADPGKNFVVIMKDGKLVKNTLP